LEYSPFDTPHNMSQKPIFVATHPRACSTAFERVWTPILSSGDVAYGLF
jgi:hypothetical protein